MKNSAPYAAVTRPGLIWIPHTWNCSSFPHSRFKYRDTEY